MRNIKVAIIGAGSSGLSARREVAKVTDDYLLFDGGTLGTTCARVGCMPSKVLIQVAEDFHRRSKFDEEGILGSEALSIDHKRVMAHVRKLRDRFVRGVTESMSAWNSEKLISEFVEFKDGHTLRSANETFRAEKIIIATGTTPSIPEVFEGFEDFIITTDSFFELEELPASTAVIGLGVIGIEIGQALHRLGTSVVGIARRENIAGVTDPKLNKYIIEKFSKDMTLSFEGVSSLSREGDKLKITSGNKEFLVEKVLVTTGRKLTLDRLNINAIDPSYKKTTPEFCNKSFALKDYPHIFIAGDNTGVNQVLHVASDEGKIAGYNSVHDVKKFKARTPLLITFSDPNIASIGKTYQTLLDEGAFFEIGEVLFEGQGRSIVKLKEIGMLRVYADKKTGVLLGCELFAPDGEHLAHLLSWAISQSLRVRDVLSLPFYHPVTEEGLRTALRDLNHRVGGQLPVLENDCLS